MKHICALPWVGFSNDPDGKVRPCCISKDLILDEKSKPMYIQKNSVKSIFHSEFMHKLRNEFKQGGKPNGCSTCWKDEENGYKSKRLIYLDIHKNDLNFKELPAYPIDYQLILTNACNLKCRSCGTSHSTSWINETKQLSEEEKELIFQSDYEMPHGQSGDSKSVFLEDIDKWGSAVRRMEVVGGEPFYTNVWEKVWDKLIEKGYSKDIVLTMSTNCTIYKEDLIRKLVKNFKSVGIGLSIDGTKDTFEYLRKNAEWDVVQENLKKYWKLHQEINDYTLTFNYTFTVSWVNAYTLPELTDWVKENTPGFRIWYNLVHWPPHLCINQIPKKMKEYIEDKLSKYEWGDYKKDIDSIINFMYSRQVPDKDFINHLKRLNVLDKYRNENSRNLFIKYYPLLQEYYDDF